MPVEMTAPDIDLDALDAAAYLASLLPWEDPGDVPAAHKKQFCEKLTPDVVLELIRRVREAESFVPDVSKLGLSEGDTVIVKFSAGAMRAPDDWLRTFDRIKSKLPSGCSVLFFTADFDVANADEENMHRAGWVRAEKLEQAESRLREVATHCASVEQALTESRANDAAAMGWLADCRIASGDGGNRMLPEFVEYLRGLKAGTDRYEKLRKFNVSQFKDLFQSNLRGEGRFDDLVDAWRPPF